MAYIRSSPATSSMDGMVEITDSDEMQSLNDDVPMEREANNRRLAQAVNYMRQDGGPDSHMTYMDRVKRMDEALLKQLPLQGQNFDKNLYHQLRTLILQAKQEYNEAIEGPSSRMEMDEDLDLDYSPPPFEEALERGGSEPASPTPGPTRKATTRKAMTPRRAGKDDNVERVRKFKYGSGETEPENWHKDFPPILPFPETLMMAHWESLKIDYDLNRPKDAKTVETNVPLNHPSLQKYFNLPLYESGSRFKLPSVSEDLQKEISKYGTGNRLREVLNDFYDPNEAYENADYAPRVFLEKFKVGNQLPPNTVSPTQVRRALASTPTNPRSSILRKASFSNATAGPSSRVEKTPRPQTRTPRPVGRVSPSFTRISSAVRAAEAEEARIEQAAAKKLVGSKPLQTRKVASHVSVTPKRGPGRPSKNPVKPVAPVQTTPSRRTGTLGFTPSIEPIPPVNTAPVKSTPSKRTGTLGFTPSTVPVPEAGGPSSVKKSTGKRKQSIGSQPYAEPKPDPETPRKRRKSTPGKTVNFVDPVDDDNSDSDEMVHVTPTSSSKKGKAVAKGKGKAPAKPVFVNPAAEASESYESEHEITSRIRFDGTQTNEKEKGKGKVFKKTSKAAAAGKAVKKREEAKKTVKGKGTAKGASVKDVRTTRSGARYTL